MILMLSLFLYGSGKIIHSIQKTLTIVLDAGHGGIDGGCVGREGTMEKDLNLEVVMALKKIFEENGYETILTRDKDYDLASKNASNRKSEDIRKRVKIINDSKALLYLSIHCNSFPEQSVHGAQVFYKHNDNLCKSLAENIQESIKERLKNTNRFAKTISDKFILDNSEIVGCLVEIGFLSNPNELNNLKNKEYQRELSLSIYHGVAKFLES